MYTSEDAKAESAEWLDELNRTTHAELLARYLDLSERYDYVSDKLQSRNTLLWVMGFALVAFIGVYWFGMPF